MLNNRKIRIQKPPHTILRTALLALLQFPASDRPCHALLPADICEIVDRLLYPGFLGLVHDELLELLLVFV